MSQQLKRWESPRREGRNDKGRGGSARQRQKQKQMKALRLKLKQSEQPHSNNQSNREGREPKISSLLFLSSNSQS